MKISFQVSNFALSILICSSVSNPTFADEKQKNTDDQSDSTLTLDSMVISADPIQEPFKRTEYIKNNLGQSNDGAELLKQSPGVSVIRQGGTASDPLLRGLGGTRLKISIDGVPFTGVCNHRMDPATAYVKPGTFDSMSLLKGPQSVRNGNSITGTVNFDREPIKYDKLGVRSFASYLYGSFNQQDLTVDSSAGFNQGYIAYTHNNSRSDNYVNGDGNKVKQTFFDTANDRLAIGYTPDDDTLLEVSGLLSEGEMGNATIHMDATKLDRQNYGIHFKKQDINSWLKALDIRYNFTKVDHAMDNFTLRPIENNELLFMGQYWKRHLAKVESTIDINPEIELIAGIEYFHDSYDANKGFIKLPPPYSIPFNITFSDKDHILDFDNFSAYTELSYQMNQNLRWVAGLRGDSLGTRTGLMKSAGQTGSIVLSGSNKHRRQALIAGFLRAEYAFDDLPFMLSVGYGHAERAADYWEVFSADGFALDEEKNDEIDAMLSYRSENLEAELSAFYSYMSDFILIEGGAKAENINAHRTGGELSTAYNIHQDLTLLGNVSYTYGQNLTRNVALAQTPPLEGSIGLKYNHGPFSGLLNTRLVAEQTRIDKGFGNILAVDTTSTAGFIVSSLELGYEPHPAVEFKFGIDNLFDKTYTEHLNRNGSGGFGIPSQLKVFEPGRAYWGRVTINFDYPS